MNILAQLPQNRILVVKKEGENQEGKMQKEHQWIQVNDPLHDDISEDLGKRRERQARFFLTSCV